MKSVRWPAALATLLASMALVPAAGAAGLKAAPAGGAQFPSRSLAITPPFGTGIAAEQVHVTENGKPVPSLTVTSSTAAAPAHFGVVILIDTSRDMGASTKQAFAAAKAFASHQNPHHPLGVITYDGKAVTRVALTKDLAAIDAALDRVPASRGSRRTYDAISGAISLLRQGGAVDGSIVVVSNGPDTGSRLSATDAVAQARAAGMRIFSVGINGPGFDPSSLQQLATGTDGEYSAVASPRELETTLDQLGQRISREYLVTYRSLAHPGDRLRVAVTVDGIGTTSFGYVAPALPDEGGGSSDKTSAWDSTGLLLLVTLVCAALVGFVASQLLRPNPRSVQARMSQFISPPSTDGVGGPGAGPTAGAFEQSLERTAWWAKFKEDLEIARIHVPAIQVVIWTLVATGSLFLLFLTATSSIPIALLAFFTPVGVWLFVQRRLQNQRKRFSQQLAETLTVVSSAMRAGHSLVAALTISVQDAPEPTRREFDRVLVDERLGVPLEDGLRTLAVRMDSTELEQVVVVATLQHETGGNTAEVLELVAASIRERIELRGMVNSLTAQGRASRWILTLLPVGLFLFMAVVNPAYMRPLTGTSSGQLLIAICIALVITGSLVIKRIVEIKV